MNKTYSGEQIEAAIALSEQEGVSKASRQLGICRGTIYKWLVADKAFKAKLAESFKSDDD